MISSIYNTRTNALRYLAREISTLVAAFILLFVIGGLVDSLRKGTFTVQYDYEHMKMTIYSLLILAGTVLGWWKDILGGALLTLTGIAFALAVFIKMGSNDYWIILIFGLPFLISGLIYLLCWRREKTYRASAT